MTAMWSTWKSPQSQELDNGESPEKLDDEKTKEDYEIDQCLKLVMIDFRSSTDQLIESTNVVQLNSAAKHAKRSKNKTKSSSGQKHNQNKCARCTKLHYVVNILVEGCLMALVRQSLEHLDLLVTRMELAGVTDRAVYYQYLQHGMTLSEKVEKFYQRQDRMYDAFKVCARMRHAKTAQDMIKQGFQLLNEMRELNNKYQVSIDNFCNLMAEYAGVPVEE